jgi:Protein of unknown function (DUF1570)
MVATMPGRISFPGHVTRRTWIAGVLATGLIGAGHDELAQEIDDLKASLKMAGIERFRLFVSEHYLAIGNGTERFLRNVLHDCELVASAYREHFRVRGFDVKPPTVLMSIVALANKRDFVAFVPDDIKATAAAAAGVYNRKSNQLIVFLGFSPQDDRAKLTHEATHQLTFNTGLLARDGDVPKCIVEGFGCYGECHNADRRPDPGQRNFVYMDTLKQRRHLKTGWIPLAKLLLIDGLLIPGAFAMDVALAYAESWILVHYLMNDPSRLPGFRSYLAAIKGRRDPTTRLADAKEHLGDLAVLESDLKRYCDRWLRT